MNGSVNTTKMAPNLYLLHSSNKYLSTHSRSMFLLRSSNNSSVLWKRQPEWTELLLESNNSAVFCGGGGELLLKSNNSPILCWDKTIERGQSNQATSQSTRLHHYLTRLDSESQRSPCYDDDGFVIRHEMPE